MAGLGGKNSFINKILIYQLQEEPIGKTKKPNVKLLTLLWEECNYWLNVLI